MYPRHYHYVELYHNLQSFTPLNNLFGHITEYSSFYWIWVSPSWRVFYIPQKEQEIIKYTFQFVSEKEMPSVKIYRLTLISDASFHSKLDLL